MTYDQALEYIHSREKFGSDLGLDRMRELMKILGDPQDRLKIVHVAGTNGKGSTVRLISAALCEQGYRTGTYISPFVERFNERIQLGLEPISDEALAKATERVRQAADVLDGQKKYSPATEFEIVTAAAFCCFAEWECEYVVLEVGLGGRLDATNIVKSPLVSVITSISLDHTEILGNTLSEIAGEKCGIIKKNRPVVLYPGQPRDVTDRVEQAARESDSEVSETLSADIRSLKVTKYGSSFEYKGLEIRLSMCGKYQVYNAVTALEAIFLLRKNGVEISDESIVRGFENTRFFGRLYRLGDNIILDGGHNPDGIDSLCDYIDSFIDGRLIVMMGILKDKDYAYCIRKIASRADIYCGVEPNSPRKLPADENAGEAHRYCVDANGFVNIENAVMHIRSVMKKDDTLLVCGSLYMLAEAAEYIKKYLL